jgi:predicted nucleotidyltransferase
MVAPVEEIRHKIGPTLKRFGVVRASLFGSAARNELTYSSDLDFLVEFEPGRSLLDLVGLQLELAEVLGQETDVVTYRSLHPRIRDRVLSEQVPVL